MSKKWDGLGNGITFLYSNRVRISNKEVRDILKPRYLKIC